MGTPDRLASWAPAWPRLSVWLLATTAVMYLPAAAAGQTTSALQGRVADASGGALPNATVTARHTATGATVARPTDGEGRYQLSALTAGQYRVSATATGFRGEVIEALTIDVGRIVVRDFRLAVADRLESVVVRGETPLVDRAAATVGHVVSGQTIQQIPLNGRHFMDLGLLVPTAVAPSQTGFSSRPIRGIGALAFNAGGNREEAVAYVVNGVTTNNLTFGSLIFEPPLGSIQELKVDTAALAPEHGHVSGAVVNVATRSGSGAVRGDVFEFFRDDALDARNVFEFNTPDPAPFHRDQFGGSVGGPIWRGRTFFHASYEGLRQRQEVAMNSLVPSEAQRAAVSNPIVRALVPFIPPANSLDANGVARYVGTAAAMVETDRWALDLRHTLGRVDRLQGYFGSQHVRANEPGSQGNSIPGFGQVSRPYANILTIGETHVFRSGFVNEARVGRSYLRGGTFPATALNPGDYGIANGVTRAIGLPQFVVAGDLNFGGPATLPQGRYDTSYVVNDTLSGVIGRHTLRTGGEYRHFTNENFAEGTGSFNFPTLDAFLAGLANAFSITLGQRWSVIDQRALAAFAQDRVRLHDRLTLDVGLRYEWHVTPTERDDKFVVFEPSTASLVQLGLDATRGIYRQNHNVEPRLGVIYSLTADGRSIARASYSRTADQPGTTTVRDTAGNPPWATPLTAAGTIPLDGAIDSLRPAGLSPATVDPGFRNAVLDSWTVNVQRQLTGSLGVTAAYLGSRGRNLRISRNLNQPLNGVRPFPTLSAASPIRPSAALGNITQVESSGFSRYDAIAVSATRRLAAGLQLDGSYTWSRSSDTNSLNSSGFAVQDSGDIPGQYGPSDFDARHRVVLSGSYSLPFTSHRLTRGWQVAAVVQSQSGNPVNIVTATAALNGTPNSVRPDLTGPIRIVGRVDQWFDTSVFRAVDRFGNLRRNAVVGPAFHNTDVSLIKNMRPSAVGLQFRVDVFDVFNHPNLGPPGNIVGTPAFGAITRTRLPTGEAGSSRQIQLAIRASF